MVIGGVAAFSGAEAHPMQMINMERIKARFFISKVSPPGDSNLRRKYQRMQRIIYCGMYSKVSIR
jgi:hypothetical protein